jgi:hypothetical protein
MPFKNIWNDSLIPVWLAHYLMLSETVNFLFNLDYLKKISGGETIEAFLIFGGDDDSQIGKNKVIPWKNIDKFVRLVNN